MHKKKKKKKRKKKKKKKKSITIKIAKFLLFGVIKVTEYLLLTDICQQQISRLLASDRCLSLVSTFYMKIFCSVCQFSVSAFCS